MKKLFKYPKTIIIVISVITVFLGYNLKNVEIDNNTFNFLPETNTERVAMDLAKDVFGSSLIMSVGIEVDNGSIFTPEALTIIDKLTNEFLEIDGVDKVKSLTNSDFIDGVNGSLVVSPLVEEFSGTKESVNLLKDKILSWDVYQNIFVSNDYSASQIMVTINSDIGPEVEKQIYFKLKELTENIDAKGLKFYVAGLPAMTVLLTENMKGDLLLLIPFVIIVLLIALFLSFRRLSGIVIPMITVVVSTIWTIGLMGLVHVPLSMLGIIIPVLMMAVGSAYGIHVISHYYDDVRDYEGELTKEKHDDLIFKSLTYVRKPVFLAGITTVAGFASLSFSLIAPMRNFGIFTSVGIVFAVIIALTLIPALLVFNYNSATKKREVKKDNDSGKMEKALGFYYDSFGKRKFLILFMTVIILAISAVGTKKLIIDNSIVEYFKETTSIRISDKFLKDKFTGVSSFDVIINGEGAGTDPALLLAMENLSKYLTKTYPEIPKVISFTDTVKRMNQVMHVDGDDGLDDFSSDYSDSDTTYDNDSFYSDDDSFYSEDDSFYSEDDSFYSEDDSFYSEDDSFYSEDDSFYSEDDSFYSEDDSFYSEDDNGSAPVATAKTYKNKDLTSLEFMNIMTNAYANADNPNITAVELLDLLKRETNYKGYSYFEIPSDPQKYGHDEMSDLSNLLSQYYSMTGKLEGFIGQYDDPLSPENIKMTIMLNSNGNQFTRKLIPVVKEYISNNFPDGYKVSLAGAALAEDSVTRLITSSAINSILISLVMVFIILSIAYKSLVAGLFGMIPLGFTVLFNYGLMGFLGVKLDIITAMLGSIAIGIGIDYTIHFMASYHKFAKTLTNENQITKFALMSSGKAIIFNALSVAAGFAVLLKSNFYPLMYLGALIAMTMLVASVAAMTIMPGLFNIFKPKFIRK